MNPLPTLNHVAAPPTPGLGDTMLDVSGLAVAFGGKQIVAGVDFQVKAGEIVSIIGPNGAGKSTILGALAGDHSYEGSALIGGREVRDWSVRELALRRAVLRQHNAISFPFSVVDVVKMGRSPWQHLSTVEEDDRIIAQEMLQSDTLRFAERTFTSLSGGERARVALARAMAQRSGVLLLDEPTAALDINYQEQVLAIARRYARQGNAVVVVLHDLAAAAAYTDRVLMIADGGQQAWGTPAEVLTSERVSDIYRHPVRVMHEDDGSLVIAPVRFADDEPAAREGASASGGDQAGTGTSYDSPAAPAKEEDR